LICWHVLYIKYEFSISHHTEISFDEDFTQLVSRAQSAKSHFWESSESSRTKVGRKAQSAKLTAESAKLKAESADEENYIRSAAFQ